MKAVPEELVEYNSTLTTPSTFFTFVSPSESGTTKYLPNNYLLINVTTNITNFVNMTLNVYNQTALVYSNLTTANASFWNVTLPFTNDTHYYNITARNTTNSSINSLTCVIIRKRCVGQISITDLIQIAGTILLPVPVAIAIRPKPSASSIAIFASA